MKFANGPLDPLGAARALTTGSVHTLPRARTRLRRFRLILRLAALWLRRELLVVEVSGRSMEPALRADDRLLCRRRAPASLGAIVVREVRPQHGAPQYLVKRLVALAGDRRDGVVIRPGFCWLEGDNAAASTDSRTLGPVPRTELIAVGIAQLRGGRLDELALEFRQRPRLSALAHELWQDWRRGVDTRGMTTAASLGFSPLVVHSYEATPWRMIRCAFDALPVRDSDVLLDYGSGKGRVLVEATRYPFRRIIGVDIVAELVDVARRNVRSDPRCQVSRVDAADYAVPDDVTVIFLFNPFDESAHDVVGRRILESMRAWPRCVRVVTYRTIRPRWLDLARQRAIAPDLFIYEVV